MLVTGRHECGIQSRTNDTVMTIAKIEHGAREDVGLLRVHRSFCRQHNVRRNICKLLDASSKCRVCSH